MKWTLQWTVQSGNFFFTHSVGWIPIANLCPSTPLNWAKFDGALQAHHACTTCRHNPHIDRGPLWCESCVPEFRRVQAAGISEPKLHASFFFVAQTAPCVHAITCRRLSGLPQWSSDPQPSHVVLFRNLKEITGVCVIKLQQYVHIYSMTKIGSKPQSHLSETF